LEGVPIDLLGPVRARGLLLGSVAREPGHGGAAPWRQACLPRAGYALPGRALPGSPARGALARLGRPEHGRVAARNGGRGVGDLRPARLK